MSIEDAFVHETDEPIDPTVLRQIEIKNALEKATIGAATTIALNCGTKIFDDKSQEPAIRNIFRIAQQNALQRKGVLDEKFAVIPGQERFLPNGYVPADRSVLKAE